MAPHSSTLAWNIPWMEEPGRLQSMVSLRVGYDWATSLSLFTFMHWRRTWQLTPLFLPGESQGWGSLVGCRLWGRTESWPYHLKQWHFYIFFLVWIHFISFSSLIDMARTSIIMLNNSGESRSSCFVPDLRGNVFCFTQWECENDVCCGFVIYGLYYIQVVSPYTHSLESF